MRKIPLTRGVFALVDDEDFESLSAFSWQAKPDPSGGFYAVRSGRTRHYHHSTIPMHRQIMNAGPGMVVDHINRDSLDNRRSNLRVCTVQENGFNTGPKSEVSGYKGVTWHKRFKKWQCRIRKGDAFYHLGYFSNRHSAAIVYNRAAEILFGSFAVLNQVKQEDLLQPTSHLHGKTA